MPRLTPSSIGLAVVSALISPLSVADGAPADKSRSTQAEPDVERITVYGRHNQLVTESGLATKSDMSLMETPAPVVVVDNELINSQGADTLQELIRNVSGLTQAGNNYGIGDNLLIRGLGANYTYDGMYGGAGLGNTFNPTRSLTNVESVEVLKGPATGLYGIGSAGGVINLIEKKPQFISNHEITAKVGQWDTYSLAIDSTAGITENLAYRVVAKSEQSDGYRGLGVDRNEIYTSLKYLVDDEQDLLISFAYIDDSIPVDSIGDPIRIFNSASVGGKTASEVTWEDLINDPKGEGIQLTEAQRKQLADSLAPGDGLTPYRLNGTGLISPMAEANKGEEARVKLSHTLYFDDSLFLNQQLQYRQFESDYIRQTGAYNYVYWDRRGTINKDPRGPLVENGVLYPFAARRQEYRNTDATEKSWQYFADLRYDFQLGEVDNEILLNANYENRDMRNRSYSIWDGDYQLKNKQGDVTYQGKLPYIYDIRNPNWAQGKFEDYDPLLTTNNTKKVIAWGVGVQHVGYFGNGFTTRVGVAFNNIDQEYQHLGIDPRYRASQASPRPEADTSDNGMTYNLGVTYMPTDDIALFANHSKGRTAYSITGSLVGGGKDRKDAESLSYDLGVRYKLFDEQILGSLVVFKSANANLRYTNPEFEDGISGPEVPQYYYDGKDETTGVEVDVNAFINEQWKFNINGIYQDARLKNNPNSSSYNTRPKGSAFVSGSAWVTYSADWFALASPIKMSLGAEYVDKRSAESAAFGIPNGYIPSYTVVDLAVSYEADSWKVSANLDNLLNEEYYSKALFLGGLPGEERNLSVSFTYML